MTLKLAQLNSGLARAISTIACLAAGSLSAAAQSEGEAIVRAWVESDNRFSFVDFDAGAIASDGDTVTVTDFAVNFEIDLSAFHEHDTGDSGTFAYRLLFPAATFEGLQDTGDRFATDMFEADEMIVEFALEGVAVPAMSFSYEDISVANWSWAKIPEIVEDPDRPVSRFLPAITALYDHDFDSAIIGGASAILPAEDDGEAEFQYGKIVAGKTRAGNVSRLDVEESSIIVVEDGDRAEITVGGLAASEYHVAELFRAFLPGTDRSDDYETLVGWYEIYDIEVRGASDDEEFSFGIGKVLVGDVGVRPPSVPVLERLDELVAAGLEGNGAEPDEREIVELVGSAYGSLRLGTYEVSDVRAVVDGLEVLDLGLVGVHDLSAAGLGEFFIEDLSFQSPEDDTSGNIGEISIAGLTFPPLAALLALEDAQADGDMGAMLAAMPTLERVAASDIALDTPDMLMSLGSYVIEMANHIGPIPTSFAVSIEDADIPVSELDADERAQLEALGYDRLIGSLGLSGIWDEQSDTVDLESEGSFEDGASFSLAARIGGITRQLFENPEAAAPMAMFSATLQGASVSIEDNSLRDRIIGMVAEQQGAEPEMVRQMVLGAVPFALAQLGRPEFTASVSAALKTFLEGEGNLSAEAAPDEPVSLMGLAADAQTDPGAVVDKLNVAIEAE